jgi:hypothetical protein
MTGKEWIAAALAEAPELSAAQSDCIRRMLAPAPREVPQQQRRPAQTVPAK